MTHNFEKGQIVRTIKIGSKFPTRADFWFPERDDYWRIESIDGDQVEIKRYDLNNGFDGTTILLTNINYITIATPEDKRRYLSVARKTIEERMEFLHKKLNNLDLFPSE